MKRRWFSVLLITGLIPLLGLMVYSYSQIDLNLTLSSNAGYQQLQQQLIQLGYFNRPVSALFYTVILVSLFFFHSVVWKYAGLLRRKDVYIVIAAVLFFVFLSYPAFSHDLFNYMFDARILTKYGQNPYLFKALDFPDDLWVRFMHWTHRTYPYGPGWLILTLPFSILGAGKFVWTLFLFKFMFVLLYVGTLSLLYDINKTKGKYPWTSLVWFALQPLVIIEFLVSPHNEAATLFFLLLAIWLCGRKQNWWAVVAIVLSAGIKYTTIPLIPFFLLYALGWRRFTVRREAWFYIAVLLLPLVWLIAAREPYPWYFLPFFGLTALLDNTTLRVFMTVLSFGLLLRYVPQLYHGTYEPIVFTQQTWLTLIPIILFAIVYVFRLLRSPKML